MVRVRTGGWSTKRYHGQLFRISIRSVPNRAVSHPGQLTWKEVAQALREMKFYYLAEKALQISTTGEFVSVCFFQCMVYRPILRLHNNIVGKFPLDSSSSVHHDLESKEFPSRNANESSPALLSEQNLGATKCCISSTPEYEDTAGLLSPPPLPPKNRNT